MATETRTGPVGPALSREDVAEFQGRVAKLRELMREHSFDGIVIGRDLSLPDYARYFSNFYLAGQARPTVTSLVFNVPIVVVPLSGELSLVIPSSGPRAGMGAKFAALARARSWITRIVTPSYNPEEDGGMVAGVAAQNRPAGRARLVERNASGVAKVLKDSGLERARIGVVASWPGIEVTKSQLPNARFEPAVVTDASGVSSSLLAPLIRKNSPWEMARLERAQAAADVAIETFVEAAVDGAPYDSPVAAATYQAMLAGAEEVELLMNLGTDPETLWIPQNRLPGSRYKTGDLVVLSPLVWFDGYAVQFARTWVIGKPNEAQARVLEATKRAADAMFHRIEIGVTGEELWNACSEVTKRAGFEAWGKYGHSVGFSIHLNADEDLEFIVGDRHRVEEGSAVTLHANMYDPSSKVGAIIGDTVVVEGGRCRYLSKKPFSYEMSFH